MPTWERTESGPKETGVVTKGKEAAKILKWAKILKFSVPTSIFRLHDLEGLVQELRKILIKNFLLLAEADGKKLAWI